MTKSLLLGENIRFQHAAAYVPEESKTSSGLLPVVFEKYAEGTKDEVEHARLLGCDFTGWVLVNDSLMIYNGPELTNTMREALAIKSVVHITLHQGPPGCGKTTSIIREAKQGDYVLCPVKKAAGETAERLNRTRPDMRPFFKGRVRTLDSYLVNFGLRKMIKEATASRLLADEAFMTHSGRWMAAARLLGVSEVHAYGDDKQIPHVCRADAPQYFKRIQADTVSEEWITYRCPADAVAAWGGEYGWRVRTASNVRKSITRHRTSEGLAVPDNCVMMCMNQADKLELKKRYNSCGKSIEIMTVHESEGNTYRDVWLHRFDNRVRKDKINLYDREPYVLVAMSRHTKTFRYISLADHDLVSAWVARSQDPKRIEQAQNVDTAGRDVFN